MLDYRIISNHRHKLAESPIWDATTGRLYWADLLDQKIYAADENGNHHQVYQLDDTIGSIGLAEKGHLIIALRRGIYLFNLETEALTHIVTPEGEPTPNTRFNDGKVSPRGDFIVGTMDETFQANIGKLYHIDPSGKASFIKDGFMVSNGLAWSKDGRFMYHSCSRQQKIWRYEYHNTAPFITKEHLLAEPDDMIGRPDGAAMDTEGGYWSAGVSAGFLNRFDQDGKLDQQIALPVKAPTMPCFGGHDMKTIFITSLSHNHDEEDFQSYPLSGGVIAIKVNHTGVPVHRYKPNLAT